MKCLYYFMVSSFSKGYFCNDKGKWHFVNEVLFAGTKNMVVHKPTNNNLILLPGE